MLNADSLDCALTAIYDTALDHDAMSGALGQLAQTFRCHFADAFRRTRDYSAWHGVQVGLDEQDYQSVFLGHWASTNVWGTRRPPVRAGDLVTTASVITRAELERKAMFAEYLAPRRLHEGLRFDIWADDGWVESVSLLRPWSAGSYSAEELRAAAVLMPHLRRAAAVRRRVQQEQEMASAGLSALEHVRMGMLLLARDGRLLHANAAGTALLRSGAVGAGPDGVAAGSASETRSLQALVHAAGGPGPRSGSLRIAGGPGQAALSIIAMPVRPDARLMWGTVRPAVLLCVIDRSAAASAPVERLAALFGLTPAEAALATQLCAGQDVREIAQSTRRSLNTVRSLLARLMAKTETNRQAELVRLLSMVL